MCKKNRRQSRPGLGRTQFLFQGSPHQRLQSQCHKSLKINLHHLKTRFGSYHAGNHRRRVCQLSDADHQRRIGNSTASRRVFLSVRDLKVHFQVREAHSWPWSASRTLKAVDGVSFDIQAGETLGIVGESGCGKSTLARAILNLIPATSGSIRWMGQEMYGAGYPAWLKVRKDVQMIFQDPLASLDLRMTIAQIIAEPLRTHRPDMPGAEVMQRVQAMMARVGLTQQQINRYPHEFSGGQCQRIGIARALILEPKLIICDEPVSGRPRSPAPPRTRP